MDINFSNKKTLLTAIIILVVVNIAAWVFYFQKTDIFKKNLPGISKEECIENFSKMNEDEFLENIKDKNLQFPENFSVSEIDAKMTPIHKTVIDYLACNLEFSKDEDLYNKAKDLIESMSIQEENKQDALVELENSFSENEKRFKTVIGIVAFEPFGSLCLGDQATEKLLESSKELIISTFNKSESVDSPQELSKDLEERLKKNSKICSIINKYSDNTSSFIENEIRGDWSEDDYILENMEMPIRLGISFRLGGRNLAMETCNSIPDSKEEIKKNCLIHADYMEKLSNCIQSSGKGIDECKSDLGCAEYKTEMVNLICAVDIE